jgi:ubiquinone/menaquinone biosynthesis C-methylase UbiE
MPDAASRFSAVAGPYDAVRPQPPADLISLIAQWAAVARPDVVDLGAGTGLSAVAWAGKARQVTAVEPSAAMRRMAGRRISQAGTGTRFSVVDATAEDTGLPDGCADVVTASQAMHWFDPERALPEIARLLRPGGVLAAYDCDWPPVVDWETSAAWANLVARVDAERFVAVALSVIAHAAEFLADGCDEAELGMTGLKDVAARRLAAPQTWWWTYQACLAVR